MKELPILVLLSSVVLLCSAAPVLEQVTCSEDSGAAAARLAMHHINEHHEHGYKFRLNETRGYKVEKVDNGCNVTMQLDLLETTCHVVNPKHFEDCELRKQTDRAVKANCTVTMTVRDSDAKVTKYECGTRQVFTNWEMARICPDCPSLIPLNNPEGLKSVHEGVKKFNQNTTNKHYFTLLEVGRIKSGHVMGTGMSYYAEFVLVETHCPTGSRIIPEACKPLCPDRAHHAVCHSSYSSMNGLQSVKCEFYPPSNTTDLGPDEKEPVCRRHHLHGPRSDDDGHGPPPHADRGGNHTHEGGRGHPPHADRGGHHTHDGGKGHPPHADRGGHHTHHGGKGHPPHADRGGNHTHDGGKGPPSHADRGGHHTHDGGKGHPPHADRGGHHTHDGGKGHPPHADHGGNHTHDGGRGHPPHGDRGHRLPFNSNHPLKRFHPCHRFLTNSDPALHPICPWPHPEPHFKPKPTQS